MPVALIGEFLTMLVKSKTALAAHSSVAATSPLWMDLVKPAAAGDGAAIVQLGGIFGTWAATIVFRFVTERKLKKAKAGK